MKTIAYKAAGIQKRLRGDARNVAVEPTAVHRLPLPYERKSDGMTRVLLFAEGPEAAEPWEDWRDRVTGWLGRLLP